jgi:hypothetical protein
MTHLRNEHGWSAPPARELAMSLIIYAICPDCKAGYPQVYIPIDAHASEYRGELRCGGSMGHGPALVLVSRATPTGRKE